MEDWRENIRKDIEKLLKGRVFYNFDLKDYNSMRLSCIADVFIEFETVKDLQIISDFIIKRSIKYTVIGAGTNLILPPKFSGVILRPGKGFEYFKVDKNNVIAGSRLLLSQLLKKAAEKSIGGFEFLAGIPGSLGGSIKGNAGAFGRSIGEVVEYLVLFDMNTKKKKVKKKNSIIFEYRKTDISKNEIILEACLKGEKKERKFIEEEVKRVMEERKRKHPDEPSCGSVFKNPLGMSAGGLIEKAGLKGKKIGGAMISKKHANFIINTGKATYEDVLALIDFIKEAVFKKFGKELIEEVIIIKNSGGQYAER